MLRDVLELVLPRSCGGCGISGQRCCSDCLRAINDLSPRLASPQPVPTGMPTTWAGAAYEGVIRRVIVAWKDRDRVDLSMVLTPLLCGTLRVAMDASPQWSAAAAQADSVAVIAVPSRATGTRARGRFPVGDLVDQLVGAQRGPRPLLRRVDALRFGRSVADQAGLDQYQRGENIAGAMRLRCRADDDLRDVPMIVVDDITTTGSTLAEVSRTLQTVARGPLLAITVAATARRGTTHARL